MNLNPTRFTFLVCELTILIWGSYISIFKLNGEPAMVAGFFTAVYGILTLKLELHFAAEDKLFAKFPILHSLQRTTADADLVETIASLHRISHPLLIEIKRSAWREFSSEIKSLDTSKRSESLNPSEYIELIQKKLEDTKKNDRVIAVSLFGDDEFEDNSFERNFHEAQLRAITENGAEIERIFVCAESRMRDLSATPFWDDHYAGPIDARFASRAEVEASGLRIKYGFILIGDTLFDDRPQQRGLSGVVSINELDLERARKDFGNLERYARPLSEALASVP